MINDFTKGMVCAASIMMEAGDESHALEILISAGITQSMFDSFEPYDRDLLQPLKKDMA